MNKQALKMYNVTVDDYSKWCKENKLTKSKLSTKQKYFKELREEHESKKINNENIR